MVLRLSSTVLQFSGASTVFENTSLVVQCRMCGLGLLSPIWHLVAFSGTSLVFGSQTSEYPRGDMCECVLSFVPESMCPVGREGDVNAYTWFSHRFRRRYVRFPQRDLHPLPRVHFPDIAIRPPYVRLGGHPSSCATNAGRG